MIGIFQTFLDLTAVNVANIIDELLVFGGTLDLHFKPTIQTGVQKKLKKKYLKSQDQRSADELSTTKNKNVFFVCFRETRDIYCFEW